MAVGAIIAGASSAAGGAASAGANYQSAMSQLGSMKYQSEVLRIQSSLLLSQSAAAMEQGFSLTQKIAIRGQDALAAGRGGYAGGNVLVGAGSAGAFEIDTASLVAMDVETQQYNMALDVWNFETEAAQAEYQAGWIAKEARRGANIARLNFIGGLNTGAAAGYQSYAAAGGRTGPSQSVSSSSSLGAEG